MSRLTRLQAKLVKIEARIADIETQYPTIVEVKSYSQGFGAVSVTRQDFGPVALEYRKLLDQQESIEDAIDDLTGDDYSACAVAGFREVQT